MSSLRSSQINRVRTYATTIFGPGFEQAWFTSKFNRGLIPKLEQLAGAHVGPKGKEYAIVPPIFFPDGNAKKLSDVFLNPAIIKVSAIPYQVPTTQRTDTAQVLKVMLLGPMSIITDKKPSGPMPYGIKWGLRRTTAGAIAFAATVVSTLPK